MRLSLHILLRNHGQPEDFRYAAWRQEYGKIWWIRSLFHVFFFLQGVLLWLVSAPIIAGQFPHFGPTPHLFDILGIIV
jgi:steroid 5-alpha reductase family enzyme